MRKKILGMIFVLLFMVAVGSADTFENWKKAYFTLCVADYGTTIIFTQHTSAIELNPLAKHFVDKPVLCASIGMGIMVIQNWGLDTLKEHNKTIAYVVLGIITAIKVYAVYNNWELLPK